MKTKFMLTILTVVMIMAVPAVANAANYFDVWDSSDPENYVLVGQINPIATAQSGQAHYNYFSASAHPSGVNLGGRNANIWLHENTNTGDLTFGFVFGMDNSRAPRNRSTINFRIIDSDSNPNVSQSDDPGEAVETPVGSNAFIGSFYYGNNTDGIAVSGISGEAWTIIVQSVNFGPVILNWFAANGYAPDYSDDLSLVLGNEYRITPAGHTPSGAPVLATNNAPVAEAGVNQSFDCIITSADLDLDGSGSSDVDGDDLSYSWSYAGNEVSTEASFSTALSGGDHVFTLTVSDGEASSSDEVMVTVFLDETAPDITVPDAITVSNEPGTCGATVNFSVSATDDCSDVTLVADPASGSVFELGTTEVTVTATDEAGNVSKASFNVTVRDAEAPTLVIIADPVTLWPPNHNYVTFDLSDFVVSVDDNCSNLTLADVIITSVTSDEAEDARGGGDGKTRNDIVIGDTSVDLRAERQGGGNGRVYTIHMAISDHNGNSSAASCQVHVPQNNKGVAVDDGPVYVVNASALGKMAGRNDGLMNIAAVGDIHTLNQNFPNPFNPSTTLSYSLPQSSQVSLVVYDLRGSLVSELVNTHQSAGVHTVHFDATNFAAGTYLYVLEANGERSIRRMLLLK